ncbi:MAG: cysteine desulfurase-like protein [Acidobacteriota bacterium]|nr:cysteine desulfurase-like protein [Acidobacteriota bacterium]
MTVSLDLDFVRRQFPALADGYVYMDNAGGSQTLKSVVDRIGEYLLTSDVQLGATYRVSQTAGERVAAGEAAMARYINAVDPGEVVMGSSTSLLLKILSWTLSQKFRAGDEIIVCHGDHEANIAPWQDLTAKGIAVKSWLMDPETLEPDLDDLEKLITPRTRLVAVHHISNILGTINPIRKIADLVHRHGALICVDGVAYAPHRAIDVQAMDVDFYAFSFYKVYGPHYALLYARKELLDQIPGINFDFIDKGAYRFQPGNVNFEFAWGMTGLPDYIKQLAARHFPDEDLSERQSIERGFDLIAAHEEQLSARLLDFLNSRQSVRIIGHPSADRNKRVPTVSFVVDSMNSDTVTLATDPHNIGIRFGDFYAKRLIADLGLIQKQGVVRVSMVHYNTLEEVDRLIEILDRTLPE